MHRVSFPLAPFLSHVIITVNYRREYGAGEALLTLSTDRIWSVEDALGRRTVADLGGEK